MRQILMPQAGKSGGAVTIRTWLKAAGQGVTKGEILAQLESADGLIELEATEDGILTNIMVGGGKTAPANTPIAQLSVATESAAQPQAAPAAPAAPPIANTPSEIGNPVAILMPQAGNSMEEGIIVKWMVKEGDRITKGQVIYEIETDKANMEVEATDSGRLAKIIAFEGTTVPVKQPVAYLSEGDVNVAQTETKKVEPQKAQEAQKQEASFAPSAPSVVDSSSGTLKASPAAKKLARESGIDLASIATGSGPAGRILSTDLIKSHQSTINNQQSPISPTGITRKKMSKMRKAIAANLQISKQTVPHFYLRGTINADPMMSFYRGEKAKYPCSVNDVVTLACAKAIIEFPAFRSKIESDEIVEYPSVNIGVAVGVEDGLTVPVILNAHTMNLQQIAATTRRVVESARAGKLEGYGQGNFTITNLGMFGVEEFAAIVNPPEPGILAVGAVREAVIVKDGAMRPGKVMTMTLSCDHRLVDGLLAAKFMARLKELLENPGVLA